MLADADPGVGVELPAAPDAPLVEGEFDPGEVAVLVEAGAPLVSVAVLGGQTGVPVVEVTAGWTDVGGIWQLDASSFGAVALVLAGVLLEAAGSAAVADGGAACRPAVADLPVFAARLEWVGRVGWVCGTAPAGADVCCTRAGTYEDTGAATTAVTAPCAEVP